MEPAEVMDAYLSAWQRGDTDAAWAFYADDIVMHLPGRGRLAGEHRGRAAVVAAIESLLDRSENGEVEIELIDRMTSADRVAMLLHESVRRGSDRLDLRRINSYRVVDGQITEIWIFEANQYEVDEFFG